MADKTIYENPKTTDAIIFDLPCPDANNCFTVNPYKVNKVTIYYVERDFMGTNYGEYDQLVYNDDLEADVLVANAAACANPTTDNINAAQMLKSKLESTAQTYSYYFKDCQPVEVLGSDDYPAWLSSDPNNAFIELVETDVSGNAQFGHFQYQWQTMGSVRAGDYFICWTWTPLPAGDSISAHLPFTLLGDQAVVVTIPSHATPEEKYEVLLERYLPEMYKFQLSDNDLTPLVLDYFNKAIANGFKFMEDMANQLIDLFDANVLHESLLVYLANLFNLKLKSSDPTLWRRQIKEAVPLFKMKGTLDGLEAGFAQAGMRLEKLTRLWQVVSKYVWQESFKIKEGDELKWSLYKNNIVEPIDPDYFGLWLRAEGSITYDVMSQANVTFAEEYGVLKMTWVGETLNAGDIVRVKYQYRGIPSDYERNLEDYIQTNCPLADLRDETDQDYPPKNWNVRVLEEDDPLFSVIIPVRHPYHDWLVFGKIRTEFPFSENIYNMEEFNGSTRDSTDVCFIDKGFIDPCGSCLGSLFNMDVASEELSDDRIAEIHDIIRERTPFHAVVHSINLASEINEFIQPPVETIETLITVSKTEYVISGEMNPFFNRVMHEGLTNWAIHRDDLASRNVVATGTGTAHNDIINIVVPNEDLEEVAVLDEHHILEVLAPSPNAGSYTIGRPDGHIAEVLSDVNEPVNESMFTFKLSNILYSKSDVNINPSDVIRLTDVNGSFELLSIVSIADNPDQAWKVTLSTGTYPIVDILPNNILILFYDGTIPQADQSNVTYTLKNADNDEILNSTTGEIGVECRALVNLQDVVGKPTDFIQIGDLLYYNSVEYQITGFSGENPYITGYTDGTALGVSISIRRRLMENVIGYFGYSGIWLDTGIDYETNLGIVNGKNAVIGSEFTDDNNFVENYLVVITIDGTDYYYKVVTFDHTRVVLTGLDQKFGTDGTSVQYSIIHLVKGAIDTQWMAFDQLDRRGKDPVVQEIYSKVDQSTVIVALSQGSNSGFEENVAQEEGVTFEIVHRDGTIQHGEI